jgi:hypothetical protein
MSKDGVSATIASVKSIPTMLNIAISTSDPLNEEAPTPEEGTIAEPPGPDRLGLEISDPTDTPCIALLPKIFPLAGGYCIPTGNMIEVATTDTVKNLPGTPNLDEFHLWFESMRYGITNLMKYSIQARNTLFTYAQLDTAPFTPETNLVSRFTVVVNFLTPNDPLYHKVTSTVL